MQKFTILFSLLFLWNLGFSQQTTEKRFDCYTVVAGKDATRGGSVIVAHNEDDRGDNIVNWFKIERQVHDKNETITLKNGAVIPQVDTTYGYTWLEMPGQDFADSYMNEFGVTIASNACPSIEKNPELTDGGIGYWLRRLMTERAKTAREAVEIGGELIEKYGYTSSGRTYSIADPNEAWVMAVVNGKHWVAQRIPDDEVMVIPNYYTITTVDLSKETCMGSEDIIEYAQERGWYNPREGVFNFREAYGDPLYLAYIGNIARKWMGMELISGREFEMDEPFPFTLKPENKLELSDFMRLLENHYEGTKFDDSQNYKNGDPHSSGPNSICAKLNQYGFVAELRPDMPVEIGAVMWLAPRRPCVQPYIPWHLGMKKIPDRFALSNPKTALEQHFDPPENLLEISKDHAFAEYVEFSQHVDDEYKTLIPRVKQFKTQMQQELFEEVEKMEEEALKLYKKDREAARKIMMDFTEKYLKQTQVEMNKIIIQSGQAVRK